MPWPPCGVALRLGRAAPTRFFGAGDARLASPSPRSDEAFCAAGLSPKFGRLLKAGLLPNGLPPRAGLSPNDGATHHGLFDISYLSCIPNAVIMQPRHEDELQDMLYTSITNDGPSFIRYPRGNALGVPISSSPKLLDIGKAEVVEEGSLGAIWAIGDFVAEALSVNQLFNNEYGEKFTIVNARFIKPLDADLLSEHGKNTS